MAEEDLDTEELVRKKCRKMGFNFDELSEEKQEKILNQSDALLQRVGVK